MDYNYYIQWSKGTTNTDWRRINFASSLSYSAVFEELCKRSKQNTYNSYRIVRKPVTTDKEVVVTLPAMVSVTGERRADV